MVLSLQDVLLNKMRPGTLANRTLVKFSSIESLLAKYYTKIPIGHPIFIVGAPRSGTSALYNMLIQHHDLAHLTQASDLFPDCPILANHLFHLTGISRFKPTGMAFRGWSAHGFDFAEGFYTWQRYWPHKPVLEASDVTEEQRLFYHQVVQKHRFLFQRPHFINKSPFNSLRINYLNEIFPEALFIHIHRDGRAVASSTLEMRIKYGSPIFPFGPKPTSWLEIQKEKPLIACGLQWMDILDHIQRSFTSIPAERQLTLGYNELCEDPVGIARRILSFCRFPEDNAVIAAAGSISTRDYKWQTKLIPAEIAELEKAIGDGLSEWGYIRSGKFIN